MVEFDYRPTGVCSQNIHIVLDGETIQSIKFLGGCNGNTQGVSKLAQGRNVNEVISLLKGIHCGYRPTSCPDQLARALELAKRQL